jgi:hypothetical protein
MKYGVKNSFAETFTFKSVPKDNGDGTLHLKLLFHSLYPLPSILKRKEYNVSGTGSVPSAGKCWKGTHCYKELCLC